MTKFAHPGFDEFQKAVSDALGHELTPEQQMSLFTKVWMDVAFDRMNARYMESDEFRIASGLKLEESK
jgi:hypothetical protein